MKRLLLLIPMLAAIAAIPDLAQLEKMIARFKPTELRADVSKLSPGDRQALPKLIEAARVLNGLFLTQMWSGNHALYAKLRRDTTPLGKARLDYFWLNKSPWSDIDGHEAFLPDVPPKKLPGANFYPEDMTREEFEAWVKTLSKPEREQAEGFFTVIRRDANRKLRAVPYSQEYRSDLEKSAKLLEQAAGLTDNATLKQFLTTRAAAFRSNDYYESDIEWMDLDAPIDITIGPYETYNDDIFGYKASFEVYVNLRDEAETAKLKFFADHLQEVENNLPIDPRYRNPKLGGQAPIRVVNEIFDAGDAAHGVQTAAYNLPNDERVVTLKGSKRVMLKNVQEAKFHSTLEPIAKRVLSPAGQKDAELRLVLHAYPGARAEPRNRAASDHRRRPRYLAAPGAEGTLQRDRRGQGRCNRTFHAATSLRPEAHRRGPGQRAPIVHDVSCVHFPHAALWLERSARQGDGHAGELSHRQRRIRRASRWHIRSELREDPRSRSRSGSRTADLEATGDYAAPSRCWISWE